MTLNADQKFFFEHAGFSYMPGKETLEQGKERCARNLAAAEGIARNAGVSFQWSVDPDIDSSSFGSKRNAYALWMCIMRDSEGEICGSLGGVDFGRDGEPWSENYRRVVEAELADEYVSATLSEAAAS